MLFIRDILLVEFIDVNRFLAMRSPQQSQEVSLEVSRVLANVLLGIFTDELHLSNVALGHGVLLESVFITHLSFWERVSDKT